MSKNIEEESNSWDLFISHASEDKNEVATPLALRLATKGLNVWLDIHELKLGDILGRKIDEGLANSTYGVVILSHHFFSKEWPQRELDGLAAREEGGNKVILPIWHDINKKEIERYSPLLASRLGVPTNKGLDYVVDEICKVVGHFNSMDSNLSSKRYANPLNKKSRDSTLKEAKRGWFRKDTVQAALITGTFLIASTLIAGILGLNEGVFPKKENLVVDSTEMLTEQEDKGLDSSRMLVEQIKNESEDTNKTFGQFEYLTPNEEEDSSLKPVKYDTLNVLYPSRYGGASIEIDGMPALVLERTRTTAKLRVPVKHTNQIIEIKKDGEPSCIQELPLNSDKLLTPCQN